jgi:hypothetical protein
MHLFMARNYVNKLLANLCKLQHGELSWVSQVERTNMITLHESHQSSNLKGFEER